MTAGKLTAAGIYTLRYNGTDFILQGEGASGNAAASDLLSGKTASTDAGDIVGTMPNNGAVNRTPSNVAQSIPAGFTTGGTVAAVPVDATKVLTGTTIAGTAGTMPNNGAPTFTPSSVNQNLPAGYISGGTVLGDAELVSGNIANGVNIFNVIGSLISKAAASGSGVFSPGTQAFAQGSAGTSTPEQYIAVSGLAFNPSFVLIMSSLTTTTTSFTLYDPFGSLSLANSSPSQPIVIKQSGQTARNYQMGLSASLSAGFVLPVWAASTSYAWFAFK